MLASIFIRDGVDVLINTDSHVERYKKVEPTLEQLGLPPVLTSDAKLLARISGLVTALTAVGLAVGKAPRLCAFLLGLFNFPITVVNNPVWAVEDGPERQNYWRGLVQGAALTGGLGMAILDDPRPRVKKTAKA